MAGESPRRILLAVVVESRRRLGPMKLKMTFSSFPFCFIKVEAPESFGFRLKIYIADICSVVLVLVLVLVLLSVQ